MKTLQQQIREQAVKNKSSAYRTWKSRAISSGYKLTDEDYILNGYNDIRESLKEKQNGTT